MVPTHTFTYKCNKLLIISLEIMPCNVYEKGINTIKYKNMMDVARSFLRLASHKKYELTIGCLL